MPSAPLNILNFLGFSFTVKHSNSLVSMLYNFLPLHTLYNRVLFISL